MERPKNFRKSGLEMQVYLIPESLLVGLCAGILIAITRYLVHQLAFFVETWIHQGTERVSSAVLVILFLAFIGWIVHRLIKREPKISGNTIPPIHLDSGDVMTGKWRSILPYKFLGSVLTLGAGLTMGLEGPSVQLGAFVGQGIGEKLKRPWAEKKQLITAGISAGLAAAFHAPLTGIVYSMEVIREDFSKFTLIPVMLSAFISDFLVSHLFPNNPVVFLENVVPLDLKCYWLLLPLAIFSGIGGSLFHLFFPKMKNLLEKLSLSSGVKHIAPFIITGIICIYFPFFFSAGAPLIFLPIESNLPMGTLLVVFLVKYILLLYCCASGLPGGVFFPVLVLGALIGNIAGQGAVILGLMTPEALLFFSLLSMAGIFASVVRAPLTAILLVMEMTGSFVMLLPLVIVATLAPLVSRYLVLTFASSK